MLEHADDQRVQSTENSTHNPAKLARTVGLFPLVVYGVGGMVGSGIYGTIGKVAGSLGNAVWLAFLVALIAAALTGLSYASLASRYPRAAGAAYVTQRAFRSPFLSYLIGLTVAASGITSMATQANVFADNLSGMFGGSWILITLLFLGCITFVNFWGIRMSMCANLLCTALEVGGLMFIIAVGARFWGAVNYLETPRATFDAAGHLTSTGLGLAILIDGAVLAFFSFMGFEDMLNIGEEVKKPRTMMPLGIILALAVVAMLYVGIAVTAISVVDYSKLATTPAPIQSIADTAAPWLPASTFTVITLFAVTNTALINFIMGSRLLYGMARQGLLPSAFGRIHERRRTPYVAILALAALVLILSMSSGADGVRTLASATALLLIFVFGIINAALIVLQCRQNEPDGAFELPLWVPLLGAALNVGLFLTRILSQDGRSAVFLAIIILAALSALYFIVRPIAVIEERLLIE